MRKQKIIISTYDDLENPYYAGGGAIAIHAIAKRLTDQYSVTVLTANYHGARDTVIDGVRYKRIGPAFLGPFFGQIVYGFLLPWYCRHLTYSIWIENFTPPFSTAFLPFFTHKPVVGFVQMLAAKDMERKYKLPFHIVENFGLKQYKQFIVTTEASKKVIERLNRDAVIFVIPLGIEQVEKSDMTSPYFLFLGRLEWNQKGLDLLLDAYRSIKNITDWKLYIAGSGSVRDEEKIQQYVKKYHLSRLVKMLGRITGTEKDEILRQCGAVVISSRFETFSLTALEALSVGKPVITFPIVGLGWIPESCRITSKSMSYESFAECLKFVSQNPVKAQAIAKKGLRLAKTLTWNRIAKQYAQSIGEVLRK